ncbi:MAG: TRAP transporter small permease [Alphaproteobacteria bacterium]
MPDPQPDRAASSFRRRCLAATDWALEASGAAFGIAVGILILLMSADIAIRFFKLGSLPWLIEIVEYVLCGGTFLAAPWVLRQGAHVRVDILLTSVPKWLSRRLEQFVDVAGCVVSAVLCYYGVLAVLQSAKAEAILFKTWWTPEWVVLLPVPIACLLLFAEFVLRIMRVEGVVREIDPSHRASI